MTQHTPLSPYRVVELSSERTAFCGQILRDLGAEVITVEPPDGSDARRFGPYANDTPGLESSLAWWAHNRDKRSLALDVATGAGRGILSRLLDDADFLVEGVEPERQAGLGLDDATLASRFPRLIAASITPFGREGPKAAYRGGELIALAASTLLSTWGDNDRPPVMMAVPQAYAHAGAEAVVGCMVALNERAASGLGQRVEATAPDGADLRHAVHDAQRPLGRRQLLPLGRRPEVRAARRALHLALQGRLRVGRALLRQRHRPADQPLHPADVRQGLLRRVDPRQGLRHLGRAAAERRGADVGVRPLPGCGRTLLRRPHAGRDGGLRGRARPADRRRAHDRRSADGAATPRAGLFPPDRPAGRVPSP